MKHRNIQKHLLDIYKRTGFNHSTSPNNKDLFKLSKGILQEIFPDLQNLSFQIERAHQKASTTDKKWMQIFVITFQNANTNEKILRASKGRQGRADQRQSTRISVIWAPSRGSGH